MARTRLYRSIVVFGTSLGVGIPVVAVSLAPACDLYLGSDHHPPPDAWHNTIADAPLPPDAWHGSSEAPPDAWPIIADAPLPPDAPPDASPDAAPHVAGAPS